MAQRKSLWSDFILRSAIVVICLVPLFTPERRAQSARSRDNISQCSLTDANTRWIQKALDGWRQVSRDFLRLNPKPLPWIVLFDEACTWHLNPEPTFLPSGAKQVETSLSFAGQPVPVHALSHSGTVQFPNGATIPAGVMAAAFPYRNGESAFYALALLDLWRKHPQASQDPNLEERILSVTLHEMVHTRQLPQVRRRVVALGKQYSLPSQVNDDIIETQFKGVPGFREAFEAERDLFYRAVVAPNVAKRRTLVARALLAARDRRARFFKGANKPYEELEDLFLNMEGAAEWARFKFHQASQRQPRSDAQIIDFLRGKQNDWAQDEGLALFLLLEKLVPRWQEKALDFKVVSPFVLLEDAINMPARRRGNRLQRARPNNSFNRSGMSLPFIINWDAIRQYFPPG